jgi:hypothetical protein
MSEAVVEEEFLSSWVLIDQAMINAFADLTNDRTAGSGRRRLRWPPQRIWPP